MDGGISFLSFFPFFSFCSKNGYHPKDLGISGYKTNREVFKKKLGILLLVVQPLECIS
jgi:hypothetical protein